MELLLWRHAATVEGPPDDDRQLSDAGHADAARVAGWLRAHMPRDTRILVSPLRRAQQTAEALELEFHTVAALGDRAIAPDIFDASGWPEGPGDVLIVGHQPSLGEAAAVILLKESQPVAIRAGSLWWFSSRDRDDFSSVFVRAVVAPDLV